MSKIEKIWEGNARGYTIFMRTYSRPKGLDENGKEVFETFTEVIQRVRNHQDRLWSRQLKRPLNSEENAELDEWISLVLQHKVCCSGRTFWMADVEVANKREVAHFNCAATEASNINDVVDIFWLLLQGCGVGFRAKIGSLNGFTVPIDDIVFIEPRSKFDKGEQEHNTESFVEGTWTITVGDSAESWAKAVGKLLAGKFNCNKLVIDLSNIRQAGKRLKGYGWISSGHVPLMEALAGICKVMNARADQGLRKIDILDIVTWLGTTLSSRRAALIFLFAYGEEGWKELSCAKGDIGADGNYQRYQSNNSLTFDKSPSFSELAEVFELMAKSGGSEPGFVNMKAARERAPWSSVFNPCFGGDSRLLTSSAEGPTYTRIQDLSGRDDISVVMPDGTVVHDCKVFSNGDKETTEFIFSNGSRLSCTPDHKLMTRRGGQIAAKKAFTNQRYVQVFTTPNLIVNYSVDMLLGFIQGDGVLSDTTNTKKGIEICVGVKDSVVYEVLKQLDCEYTIYERGSVYLKTLEGVPARQALKEKDFSFVNSSKRVIPKYYKTEASETEVLDFLTGMYSANGCVIKDHRVAYKSTSAALISELALLLEAVGIESYITTNKTKKVKFAKGEYQCLESYDLNINAVSSVRLFHDKIGFIHTYKACELAGLVRKKGTKIVSARYKGVEEVFDFSMPHTHWGVIEGVVAHNCAEILLPAQGGLCNLTEVNVSRLKNYSELKRALYLTGRANYRQTLVHLKDEILQEKWNQNNTHLRLCGVGLTGIALREDLTPFQLKEMRNTAVYGAYSMADELGTERPKNVTCVKPAGTISKVFNCTEGITKPLGKYIINNVGFSEHDPLLPKLREAGYSTFENPNDKTGVLVRFPVKWEGVTFDEVVTEEGKVLHINTDSAVKQLEKYKMYMKHWCDQNVSNTISYSPDEVPEIIAWLTDNWEDYVGVSFLYRADPTKTAQDLGYDYLPQEVITKEEYEAEIAKIVEVDYEGTQGDMEIDAGGCSTGACPIK